MSGGASTFDGYRRELTGYCYRMLGAASEAEDAVQETMIRAWQGADGFEGRSSERSWLYRIATNVCLDMLKSQQRRAQPMDLGGTWNADSTIGAPLPVNVWVTPVADDRVLPDSGDPADVAVSRESIRLAFVTTLQQLPARQRAVLILRDVLRWQASEVAELLESSVASANSALQRARETLAEHRTEASRAQPVTAEQKDLLRRYMDAFERYDVTQLVSMLHDEAIMSMPPYALWLCGPAEIGKWFLGQGCGCRGSKVLATSANGGAAFASYRPDPDGGYFPWSLHVVEMSGDRIIGDHNFLGAGIFAEFGLPAHLS